MTALPPLPPARSRTRRPGRCRRTAVTVVGAPGTVRGVTAVLAVDGALVPAALVAVTVNVYAVPLVRPVTVHGELAASRR